MVEFKFYTETYHGSSISQEDWNVFSARATEQLRRYKRIYTVKIPERTENAEAMAVCAMADVLQYFVAAQNGAGAVASASIGSVSVSYGSNAGTIDVSPKAQEKELYRAARLYLEIYRGVGGC